MLVIGLMSGTSADGIDAALVEIEGEGRGASVRLVHFACVPHEKPIQAAILALCSPTRGTVPDLCLLHAALGEKLGEAALQVASDAGVSMERVDAIASHGQTVWHQPNLNEGPGILARGTLQIGAPAVVAARTGCRVVADFRSADMAAGGQGAPLVPYFDWALLSSRDECRVVLNIGGIANLTYLPRNCRLEEVTAFDTGPGNMVIDALMSRYTGGAERCDVDGARATQGKWNDALGERMLAHPYYLADPPKSTGREVFGQEYAEAVVRSASELKLSIADVLATVTEVTARTVAEAVGHWLPGVERVIVGGGGCHNRSLMRMLTERLSRAVLSTHEEFGIPGDAKEAVAFALLGYETLHGRPSNVPSATGASRRVVLGSITPAP